MDILKCFKSFNTLKNCFPLLYNLEGDLLDHQRAPLSLKHKILYYFFSIIMATLAIFMSIAAVYSAKVDGIENILGIVYFIDNYVAPLISQIGLYIVTHKPINILAKLFIIDEFLAKEYQIPVDYQRSKRTFLINLLLFEGGFLLTMACYLGNVVLILGIASLKNLVMIYFGIIWFIFILQLVVYSTLIGIIRCKVKLITRNINCLTNCHRIKLSLMLNDTIKSANLIGNGIILLCMLFSTFYVTMDIFVVVRQWEMYGGNMGYFLHISVAYISLILLLNLNMVTQSYSLKKELDFLNHRIGNLNDTFEMNCDPKSICQFRYYRLHGNIGLTMGKILPIDPSTYYQIFSGTVTYLVILFQFQDLNETKG